MKEKELAFGFYAGQGVYECVDCSRRVVISKKGFLPCCSNYESKFHKKHHWKRLPDKIMEPPEDLKDKKKVASAE
ncbi:MAG: hypothetical protein R6W70_09610 [bacterium]